MRKDRKEDKMRRGKLTKEEVREDRGSWKTK